MKTKTKVIIWIILTILLIIASYKIGFLMGVGFISEFIRDVGIEKYCEISQMCS